MKNKLHIPILVAFCAAAFACTGDLSTGLAPSANTLNGPWTRLDEVPGSSEHWNLTVTDTVITGTGTWSGEACCSGPLTVTGYASAGSIHLDVVLSVTSGASPRPPIHEHFDGALTTTTLLEGQTAFDAGTPGAARLKKGDSAF